MSETQEQLNARKKRERAHRLPELAEKARIARSYETPEKRAIRLEKARIQQVEWRKNNPNHAGNKESKRKWKLNNVGKVNADTVKRRLAKLNRTPSWLTPIDFERIENEYKLAAILTKLWGESWHVDHIIPLQGKMVSGLHVPSNLQVLRGKDNVKKANGYLPK